MNKQNYDNLYSYLAKNSEEIEIYFEKDNKNRYTGKFKDTSKCKLLMFNEIFDTNISCPQYDSVANGEGNEEEKINSIYSSSLQSLLVFHGVNSNNKIEIAGEKFDKVIFEYKNKVIGYPSSVDVVLVNDHAIAFIESKFLEIVRDSTEEKGDKSAARKVVGISYFGKDESGYNKVLKLTKEDLDKMRISYPNDGPFIDSVKGRSKETQEIDRLEGNTFVYSEGIKQILSHIIGIQSFKNGESCYSNGNDPIPNHTFKKIIYVELYNAFPGFDYATKRIEDFNKHVKVVKDVIDSKGLIDEFVIMTYQELLKKNKSFVLNNKIDKYFHLK